MTTVNVKVPGSTPGLLRAVTRGVPPLPLGGTRRLARCCGLPFLLTGQTALTPSADPPGKPGLHHAHLPLFRGRAMASHAGRVAAPPADPRAGDARQRQRAGTVQIPSVRPRSEAALSRSSPALPAVRMPTPATGPDAKITAPASLCTPAPARMLNGAPSAATPARSTAQNRAASWPAVRVSRQRRHTAQHPHTGRTPTTRGVRPVCALRARPLPRQPAKTPCGGLPPPFPTSPSPQGTPRARSGTAPASQRAGAGENHRGTHPQQPPGFPKGFPPHPSSFAPPGPPGRPATRARALRCRRHASYWEARRCRPETALRRPGAGTPGIACGWRWPPGLTAGAHEPRLGKEY